MRVAHNWPELEKTATVADLTLRGAQKLLASPKDAEEESDRWPPTQEELEEWFNRPCWEPSGKFWATLAYIRDHEPWGTIQADFETFEEWVRAFYPEVIEHDLMWMIPKENDERLVPPPGKYLGADFGPYHALIIPSQHPDFFWVVTTKDHPVDEPTGFIPDSLRFPVYQAQVGRVLIGLLDFPAAHADWWIADWTQGPWPYNKVPYADEEVEVA
jgi:hypothetical protein